MNKKLSILICSLQERQEKLNRLMEVLKPQINDEVEVIIKSDSREMSIGTKRNSLLNEAKVDDIKNLKGVPVEATFDGTLLKSWRILTEVL